MSDLIHHGLAQWVRTGVLAAAVLTSATADALDARSALSDYALTNWAETAGPFPFGIYSIAQGDDGYLWLGARTGLVRFDGTTFTLWKGPESLLDDRISVIRIARDGSMWLGYGTIGGVTRIKDGEVRHFGTQDGLSVGDVNELIEDEDGSIWAATFGGLSRFHGGKWAQVGRDQGLPPGPVLGLFKDRSRTFWVGTSSGIYRRAAEEGSFTLAASSTAVDFAQDAAGTIWITDRSNGFKRLNDSAQAPPALRWPGALGRVLLYDRSGALWVGTRGNGLMRVRGLTGGEPPVTEILSRQQGLVSNEIRALFEDRHGTLWIATRLGISRLAESNIQQLERDDDDGAFVAAVTRTRDGSVWIGTSRGLERRSGDREDLFDPAHGLPSQIVTALHADSRGTLWAATTQGVARWSGRRFEPLPVTGDMRVENVNDMTSDEEGTLWLCDQIQGLVQWKHGRLTRKQPFEEGAPYSAYTDSSGRVWIGFWTGSLAVYRRDGLDLYSAAQGLPGGSINLIYEDRTGGVWIGTSKGLARFDGGRFTTFSGNGFPQSAVVSIVEDDEGFLWLGLASGLVRIKRQEFDRAATEPGSTLRYKVYGTEDGLPGTLGRPGMPSSTRAADGRLWFITSLGIAVVDPTRLAATPAPGPVRIDQIVADGHRYEPAGDLSFAPNTSRVQIDYSILSLATATRARFRYRLDQFDSDWQEAGDRRQALYTNLPPGAYMFRVASNSQDGGWTEADTAFAFSIQPAFYQTRAFYAAIGSFIALGVWLAWRLRLRRIHHEFDLVLAERARMGREIHDTLLQSLVGVALEFDDIATQLDDSANGLKNQVRRVREQVEHYIREARQSIWNLRSPTLESSDLPTALRHFGTMATAGNHAKFELVVNGTSRRGVTRVEEQLLRIGQEALTNAVRHSAADVIRAELTYDSSIVQLRVSDNGRGFNPEHVENEREAHWGVTSMRERAQQIGATLRISSRPGAGTIVDVTAPCST